MGATEGVHTVRDDYPTNAVICFLKLQEIAVVLINFERHMDWLAKEVKIR